MKLKIFFLVLIITIFITSCNNEVDINTDASDISIVYGLLDQSRSRHYIKLTKAFLIDGNVYTGAGDPSLSNYDPTDVQMYIDEYNSSSYIRSIPLDTFLVTDKDSGDFYFPNQIVYGTPENTQLSSNYRYELYIKIKSLDKEIKASTSLIKDFSIIRPNIGQRFVSFTGNLPLSVEYRSAENGKLYQLTIRFYYTEYDASNNKSIHYVDLPLSVKRSSTTSGGEKLTDEFYGETFFQNLASNIPAAGPGIVRYPDSVQYIFSVADETFTVYMDVNKPTTGIITEKPSYTNIENGLGVFAGRYNKVRTFEGLATQSVDTLISGQYTYALGFKNYPNP